MLRSTPTNNRILTSVGWMACALVVAAVASCVVYDDRCLGVVCGNGEVCLDLSAGPRCVCDDSHETTDAGCAALEEGSSD